MKKHRTTKAHIKITAIFMAISIVVGSLAVWPAKAAACPAPTGDFGQVSTSVSIPTTATYRIWSRIMPTDATNTSYMLEIDGSQCYIVSSPTPNTWTWIGYQDGNAASQMSVALAQGNHSVKLIGRQAGVEVDKVLFSSDATCTPSGTGGNCETTADTTPPGVALTAPAEGSGVSGTTTISATASDETGVAKVEFYVDSQLLATSTNAPYTYQWNTGAVKNGQHLLMAKAYDAAGNFSNSSYFVNVQNGDTEAPTAPSNLSAKATAYNNVALTWAASTDNVGVAGYRIVRNGQLLAQVGSVTSYQDSSVMANTQYSYSITAVDTAGNVSPSSATASATTPNVSDTQKPSAPTSLTGTTVSSQQINLSWVTSTDNIGVAGYDVYRATGTDISSAQKVATVTTTTYGDTGLSANTKYTYFVKARDAAGNTSDPSNSVTVQTQRIKRKSRVVGTVSGSGKLLSDTTVTLSMDGTKYTTTTNKQGRYVIRDVPFGRYNATYQAKGYATKTVSLKVDWNTIEKNVRLQKK